MGCLVTRLGLQRHAYAPMGQPELITMHAMTASVPTAAGGQTLYPLSSPIASVAADGAPFYVHGWQPGESVQLPGGSSRFALPPRAAQLDLSDRTSWDRPVFFPGSS